MKICQYIPHGTIPDVRGFAPAIVAQQFYKNFSNNIEHYFVCNLEDYNEKFIKESEYGKIFRIKEGKLYKRLFHKITKLDPFPLYKKLAKIINHNEIDILHVHQLEFPIIKFKELIKNKKLKIIVHSHVNTNKYNKKNGLADLYIAVSNFTRTNMFLEKGYPKELIKTISNGVDINLFRPIDKIHKDAIKKIYNIPQEKIVISFIGRKQEVKGFDIFLKIVQTLLKDSKNIFVIAIGPEPKNINKEITYYEREKIRKELKENINYLELEPMKQEKLSDIFKISDITLLVSKAEPQGMVMVESISSGCITISSNLDGIVDTIIDLENGFLVNDPNSYEEVMSKVKYILNNFERLDSLRNKARKFAIEKFDWKILTRELEQTYENLIGS